MDFYLVSTSYTIEKGRPVILLFGRNRQKQKYLFKIPYSPYFYIRKQDLIRFEEFISRQDLWYLITGYEDTDFKTSSKEELIEIHTKKPKYVRLIRQAINERNVCQTYEADVLFYIRFLVDTGIYSGFRVKKLSRDLTIKDIESINVEPIYTMAFIDIEVLTKEASQMRNKTAPVIVIGIYDWDEEKYYQYYIGRQTKIEYEFKSRECPIELINCRNEEELLVRFKNFLRVKNYDYVVTFTKFDMDYVFGRMKLYNIGVGEISLLGREYGRPHGIEIVDLAETYRDMKGEAEFHTLDYIAKKELGYGKYPLNKEIWKAWEDNFKEVLKYNLRDVEIIKELANKLYLIRQYLEPIKRIVGVNITEIWKKNLLADVLYLRLGRKLKIAFETRKKWLVPGTYTGAIVFQPKAGIYDNVLELDWSELYPSIIETLNIGYNTYRQYESDIQIGDIFYTLEEISWTASILKELRRERRKIKEKIKQIKNKTLRDVYKALSQAYKECINSAYGMYGYKGTKESPASRFYSPKIAESITRAARMVQAASKECLTLKGYEILYGDTDSLFVKMKEGTIEEANKIREELQQYIESFVHMKWNIEKPQLIVEIDKIFKRIIFFGVKKRYHGITIDGEEDIKGIEAIRKDTADLTRELQLEIGRRILDGEEIENVIKYLFTIVRQFLKRQIPIEKIMVRGRCSKAKYDTKVRNKKAMDAGNKVLKAGIQTGERFYWIYIEPIIIDDKEYDVIGNKFPTLPKEYIGIVDWIRMLKYVVISPITKYLRAMRIKIEDFEEEIDRIINKYELERKGQLILDKFFS